MRSETADVRAMAVAERSELADFLDSLDDDLWETPSLCEGWSVHDVVAHVVSYEEHSRRDLLRRLARARWRPGRLNDVALAEYRHLTPAELVAFLRSHLVPRGSTTSMGYRVGMVDALVHHQDVRRPLGRRRTVPPDRLRVALDFAVLAPPLRGFWHGRGVRLVATDVDWRRGRGPEARGPGEAVLMVLAGRRGAAHDLVGPGRQALVERLG